MSTVMIESQPPALQHWYRRLLAHLWAVLRRDWLVLLTFMLLTLALMYPVPLAPSSTIVAWTYGDNVQFVYITGWMAQAPLMGQSPFVDPRLNYPADLTLAVTDIPYLAIVLTAPVGWLGGMILHYNMLIWLFTWLSGYTVYLWLISVTRSQIGAIVGGLAFLLTPYRVIHSYGHLPYVATWSMPLFFWGLDATLRSGTMRWWLRALLMLLVTFLLGSSSQYYLVMSLVLGILYALLTLLPLLREQFTIAVVRGIPVAAGTLAGAVLGALPYLLLLDDNTLEQYEIEWTRSWSLDPINFILPYKDHPLWGDWFYQLRPEPLWGEKTLYLGIVALVLAVLAFAWRNYPHHWQRLVWLVLASSAAVLALGTDLHLNNMPVQQDNPVWLPAYYLAQLPFVDMMRVWCRFGVITILFVALLAGVGSAWVVRQFPRHGRLMGGLLCALIIIDLLPSGVQALPLQPHPIDEWLAAQPDDFAVGFMPAEREGLNYLAMYGSLYHTKHLPAFNHPLHRPDTYVHFAYWANAFPDPQAIYMLRCLNLRYLILDQSRYDGKLYNQPLWSEIYPAIRAQPDVYEVTRIAPYVVFGFRGPAPDPTTCPVVP